MSDFYENPENLRLLQKVQLKEQSGMDIKKDTIQLIAAAFESMTDEDWVEYEQHSAKANIIYDQIYPALPDIPAAKLRYLIEHIADIITMIDMSIDDNEDAIYALCLSRVYAEIANCNDIIHLYDGDKDTGTLSVPDDYNQWKKECLQLCKEFLEFGSGQVLLNLTSYLMLMPYKKS